MSTISLTPQQLINKLKTIPIEEMKHRASTIIGAHVFQLDGQQTPSPQDAATEFQRIFDDVKTLGISVNMRSIDWNRHMSLKGDDERMTEMLSNIMIGTDGVEIPPLLINRQKTMTTVGATNIGAWVIDPHQVDYVLCHVKGYRKYYLGLSGMPIYIRGRDIIITAVLASTPNIIKMMLDVLDKHMR